MQSFGSIDNEILMTIRSNKKTKSEVSLQDPIGVDKEGNEISIMVYLRIEVIWVTQYIK